MRLDLDKYLDNDVSHAIKTAIGYLSTKIGLEQY